MISEIIKRDGRKVKFDTIRISNAIEKAFEKKQRARRAAARKKQAARQRREREE